MKERRLRKEEDIREDYESGAFVEEEGCDRGKRGPAATVNEEGALTDIVRVELVDADQRAHGGEAQDPGHDGSEDGELALVEVVDEYLVEL